MPRTFETTVYKYAELSAEAQAKARDWWRDLEARSGDTFFAEFVTDDFKDVLAAAGFELHSARGRDALYWSGFGHQGSGACFDASWYAPRVDVAPMLADRPATWKDTDGTEHTCATNAKLRPLLERAAALAAKYPNGSGSLAARDRYMVTRLESATTDDDAAEDVELGEELQSLAEDLASYFYRALESEYEYTLADEQVAETIAANEYEFTAEGRPA